jgi:hypothetical protein
MASVDKLDSLFGQAIFAIKRSFTKVPINPTFSVVIEFQTLDVAMQSPTPKAYSTLHPLLLKIETVMQRHALAADTFGPRFHSSPQTVCSTLVCGNCPCFSRQLAPTYLPRKSPSSTASLTRTPERIF